jgi:hypothetical protein
VSEEYLRNTPAGEFITNIFITILDRNATGRELETHVNNYRGAHRNKKRVMKIFLGCEERTRIIKERNLPPSYLFSNVPQAKLKEILDFQNEIRHLAANYFVGTNSLMFNGLKKIIPDAVTIPDVSRSPLRSWAKGKKVALCLSGHAREHLVALPSIIEKIKEELNADVFIHCWDEKGFPIFNDVTPGPWPSSDNLDNRVLQHILEITKPVKYEILSNNEFLKSIDPKIDAHKEKFIIYNHRHTTSSPADAHSPPNAGAADPRYILSQIYCWQKCWELLEEYEKEKKFKYDYVIRMRLDYWVESFFPISDLLYAEDNHIFIPHAPFSRHGHPACSICSSGLTFKQHNHNFDVCDVFSYGKRTPMKKYMNVFNKWEVILKRMDKENKTTIETHDVEISTSLGKFPDWQKKKRPHHTGPSALVPDNRYDYRNNYDGNSKWRGIARKWVDIGEKQNWFLHCFYPERILKIHLKDLRLLPSELSGALARDAHAHIRE